MPESARVRRRCGNCSKIPWGSLPLPNSCASAYRDWSVFRRRRQNVIWGCQPSNQRSNRRRSGLLCEREMGREKDINRREFLSSTSAAALAWAASGKQGGAANPEAFRSPAGSVIPYTRQQLTESTPQRTLTGEQLSEVAFPLGGIGTGTVSLGGRGQLRDWEIFNRPG